MRETALGMKIKKHVAEVIELRRIELEAEGTPMSFEQIAKAMGEYKDAVLRIMSGERTITVELVGQLSKALKLRDPLPLLEPILGTSLTATEVEKRLSSELATLARLVTVLGQEVINDPHSVDAIRALGAIDDKAKRRQLADLLLAVARDHDRMTGARRLLAGPPSRQAIHPEIRPRPKATTKTKGKK